MEVDLSPLIKQLFNIVPPALPILPGTSKVFLIDVGVVGADDHPVDVNVSKCLLLILT